MARPIWTGTLSFGLVTVPVGLYSATEDHSVHFRQLQRGTSDRVRNQRVNERTGEEVEYRDVVKGFELAEGEYVVLEPAELEQISPGRSKSIEISGFVDLTEVDPIYFDKTYYLGPRGKEYARVYGLLHRALAETNRAGLATFVMRGKQYLAAVRVEGEVLVLQTMHYAQEVRDPHQEIDNLPEQPAEPSERELAAARQLIEMLSSEWDPRVPRHLHRAGARTGRGEAERPGGGQRRARAGVDERGGPDGRPGTQPPAGRRRGRRGRRGRRSRRDADREGGEEVGWEVGREVGCRAAETPPNSPATSVS